MKLDAKTTRELVQVKLLSSIFASSLRDEIVLKGGMAMRTVHGSMRYTKDIDLAGSPDVSMGRIAGRINAAVASLRHDGLLNQMTVSTPKQTETTQRWKIGGLVGDIKVSLTVEVSRRERIESEHILRSAWVPPKEYGLTPILLEAFNGPLLAASKTACLMDVKREAARDFFDLWILVSAKVEPPIRIIRRHGREALEAGIANIEAKLEKMTYSQVIDELLPYLPASFANRMDEDLWDEIRLTASVATIDWIRAALREEATEHETTPTAGLKP